MKTYRNLKPIKALSFDLDDTLYDNWPVIQQVEKKVTEWLYFHHPISATIPQEHWHQFKLDVLHNNPDLKHDVTDLREQQIEFGLMQLGYDKPAAKQAAKDGIELALWWRNQINVPRETHEILEKLAKKYPIVAITNGNVDASKINLSHYFKFILKAGSNGRSKPYSDMFDDAANKLNIPANQILHVGDHLISDVQGAINAGFQACWLNTNGSQLRQDPKCKTIPDIEISSLEQLKLLL